MNDTLRELDGVPTEQLKRKLRILVFGDRLLWCTFGFALGAAWMTYVYEQPKATKPVVTVGQDGASTAETTAAGSPQQARDAAPPLAQVKTDIDARFAKIDQRLEELTFAARKLAGVKQTWDLKMGEVGK